MTNAASNRYWWAVLIVCALVNLLNWPYGIAGAIGAGFSLFFGGIWMFVLEMAARMNYDNTFRTEEVEDDVDLSFLGDPDELEEPEEPARPAMNVRLSHPGRTMGVVLVIVLGLVLGVAHLVPIIHYVVLGTGNALAFGASLVAAIACAVTAIVMLWHRLKEIIRM